MIFGLPFFGRSLLFLSNTFFPLFNFLLRLFEEFCLFVETEPKARAAIRENIMNMGLGGVTRLHRRDATKLKIAPGNLRGAFSHVFIDPPYHKNLGLPVLRKLKGYGLLADNSVIIYEMAKDEDLAVRGFEILDTRIWGAAKVMFLGLA